MATKAKKPMKKAGTKKNQPAKASTRKKTATKKSPAKKTAVKKTAKKAAPKKKAVAAKKKTAPARKSAAPRKNTSNRKVTATRSRSLKKEEKPQAAPQVQGMEQTDTPGAEGNAPVVEMNRNVMPSSDRKSMQRAALRNYDNHHLSISSHKKGGPKPSGKKPLW